MSKRIKTTQTIPTASHTINGTITASQTTKSNLTISSNGSVGIGAVSPSNTISISGAGSMTLGPSAASSSTVINIKSQEEREQEQFDRFKSLDKYAREAMLEYLEMNNNTSYVLNGGGIKWDLSIDKLREVHLQQCFEEDFLENLK
jgi:hypothetical protein